MRGTRARAFWHHTFVTPAVRIQGAVKDLIAAIGAKNVDALSTAHNAFNERLDPHLTMLVRP